jgi:hypothetical protein
MDRVFLEYFRCPEQLVPVGARNELSSTEGFFAFGHDTICFGRHHGGRVSKVISGLPDLFDAATYECGRLLLPFDLSEVVTNLRYERYSQTFVTALDKLTASSATQRIYYFLRPALSVAVRKHLQRIRLRGWHEITFPHWPVDFTVETLMQSVMALVLKSGSVERIPFIWFWPDCAEACVVMTHDVETVAGLDFCSHLMDMDEAFGVKAAFQLVPQGRYELCEKLLESFRGRGFEVNIHDLEHDGRLFQDKVEFPRRATQINGYAKAFSSCGFRSGAMYRNQEWFKAFEFSYDMSVPNVAHLDPQRGGCCTVMPYFIGQILELPLTTTQDYSLFHILGDYSIELWMQQTESILQKNGLVTFLTHPDYLIEPHSRNVYRELLTYVERLRAARRVWTGLPVDVDRWWRSRAQMTLVEDGDSWRIEGTGSERATLAYATLQEGRLVYTLESS